MGSGQGDVEAEAEGGGELAQGGEADVARAVFQAGDRGLGGADLAGQFHLHKAFGLAGAFSAAASWRPSVSVRRSGGGGGRLRGLGLGRIMPAG